MPDEKKCIGLVSPLLSDRFAFYQYGPRIVHMGLGYIHSFLHDNNINSNIIDLDNYIHNKTDLWKSNIGNKSLYDFENIERYLDNKIENKLFDDILHELISGFSWEKYSIIAVTFFIEILYNYYTPVLFKLLKYLNDEYGTVIILGGTGPLTDSQSEIIEKFNFIKYVNFGYIDSVNLINILNIVKYELYNTELPSLDNVVYMKDKNQIPFIRMYNNKIELDTEKEFIIKPRYMLKEKSEYGYDFQSLRVYDKRIIGDIPNTSKISIIPYRFMIGCPNKCSFCMCSSSEAIFSCRDIDNIVDDIDRLMVENESNYFMFLNATLNISKKFLFNLHNSIKKKNLKLYFTDSAEIHGMDRECLETIRDMGGVALWYGLECPSEKMLKYINKRCTLEEAANVLKLSDEIGIWNGVNLISGLPYEDDNDINNVITFIEENCNYIEMWSLNPFYLTKSRLSEFPDEYGIKIVKDDIVGDRDRGNVLMSSFNEINGLQWPDKQKQIMRSYEIVFDAIKSKQTIPNISNTYLIFHGYTNFKSKKDFKEWFSQNIEY